jgi:hypothetical protein
MNGVLVAASTKRMPSSIAPGQTATFATRLPLLYVQSVSGTILRPVSDQFMKDTFGASVQQPAKVRALWPAGNTETYPIMPEDVLVLPASEYAAAGSYTVHGVKCYPGRHITIYVEVPIA